MGCVFASCRFEELSRALYSLIVMAFPQSAVSISVPAGKVNDISGNLNLASNQLQVEHCMCSLFLLLPVYVFHYWLFFFLLLILKPTYRLGSCHITCSTLICDCGSISNIICSFCSCNFICKFRSSRHSCNWKNQRCCFWPINKSTCKYSSMQKIVEYL